jgi:threonine/homoserine/homoserine lactone efflux protein
MLPGGSMPTELISPAMAVALVAYAVGVVSPGPSNMAILSTAMSQGRRCALALAAGVVLGSLTWGLLAVLGLTALMQAYSWSLVVLKVVGGIYLLFLSLKAARAALVTPSDSPKVSCRAVSDWRAFFTGLSMHLTNPKAKVVWMSIVALALPTDASQGQAFRVVAACSVFGAIVFFGYALAFSTATARIAYNKVHRLLHATVSAVYAIAGVRLLLSRSPA